MVIANDEKAKIFKYFIALFIVTVCTLVSLPLREIVAVNSLAMIYIIGVVVAASRLGIFPSIFTSILSVLSFNFFFTKPYHSLEFYDDSYYFTFAVMLVVSLIVGSMTARLARLVELSKREEKETHALFDFSRELSNLSEKPQMLEYGRNYISGLLECEVSYLNEKTSINRFPSNVFEAVIAGKHDETLYFLANRKQFGFSKNEILLLNSFIALLNSSIERVEANEKASFHAIESENERLRNILLSSLSHDLRTPLTIMNGTISNLFKFRKSLPREGVNELTSLSQQHNRLQKFVADLLRMAAISSNSLQLHKDNYTIAEIIGAAILRLVPQKENRKILSSIKGEIPLVFVDGALIEQIVFNLLDNAIKHTNENGEINIDISCEKGFVKVAISDNGCGIEPNQIQEIFTKFNSSDKQTDAFKGGTGLGLAICKGIIEAHKGEIHAENLLPPKTGAKFSFTIPITQGGN